MKIELEMKIKEEEEQDNNIDGSDSSFIPSNNMEKHEILFSQETSSLYASTRNEASFYFDYEVNLIHFGEEKEQKYIYIKTKSKIIGDKYIKIDTETSLYDALNFPYSGDEKILNNSYETKLAKANIFKRLVIKKKKKNQDTRF